MNQSADGLHGQLQQALGDTYTIERELGGGGMARIFVAAERRFERRVVVKVLAPDLAAGVSADRFEREVKLAAQLQQANIVPVFNAGEAAGLPFYTMPWVEGESLRARLTANGQLSVSETTAILSDVAKALAYAHAHGIVHRDIKPENILLSGGTAVVTDFGIAKAIAASRTLAPFETLTQVGTSLGTPAYMSPEQAMGDPGTDHRADLYALGVTAYEMLVGTRPFAATSPAALVRAHMTEIPAPIATRRAGLPPDLAAIVMQCLAKEPGDRPDSADAILRRLERLGAPAAVTSAERTREPARARRSTLLAAAGVIVLLIAAGTLLAVRMREQSVPEQAAAVALDPAVMLVVPATVGGDSTLRAVASAVSDAITRAVAQIPGTRIADEPAAAPSPNAAAGVASDDAIAGRARSAGAGTAVVASLGTAGPDSARVQVRVIDAASGQAIRTLAPVRVARASGDITLGPALDPLLSTLGIVATPGLGAFALPVDLPKFAAVREMMTGLLVGGRRPDSASRAALIDHIARAVVADSTYLQARLFNAATRLNFYPRAYTESTRQVGDAVVRELAPLRDRLTPFENVLYDYVVGYNRGDMGAVLRSLRAMNDLAPTAYFVASLPTTLLDLNLPREALAVLKAAKPTLRPDRRFLAPQDNPRWWVQIGEIQHYLHDYAAELAAAERLLALDPQNPVLPRSLLRAYAALGDSAGIERVLARAATTASRQDSYEFFGDLAMQVGHEVRAHGHPEFGKALVRRAIGWFESRSVEELTWRMRFRWAIAHHDLEEYDEAARVLAPLLAEDSSMVLYLGLSGRVAAGRGDTATAQKVSARLAAMGNGLGGSNTMERAFIASMLGKRDEAVALMQDAFAQGQGFIIRWRLHWIADTRPLRGYPPFERLLEPQG